MLLCWQAPKVELVMGSTHPGQPDELDRLDESIPEWFIIDVTVFDFEPLVGLAELAKVIAIANGRELHRLTGIPIKKVVKLPSVEGTVMKISTRIGSRTILVCW